MVLFVLYIYCLKSLRNLLKSIVKSVYHCLQNIFANNVKQIARK